ncbi:hypothetical protein FRB99_004013 [Tulasnella sp. 403]|nr:hypothetical protein FRB99_004013 [Tulasnella sp. 403]
MSAAEQLPVEVLGLIFTTFNDHHPNASVVITAVCQTWRRVALATPTAWQNVCIDLNRLAIFPRMADFLLKRSRGCLVNVEIVGECHLSLIQDPLIPDLQVHLDRFRTLCVEPTRDGILNGIAGGLAGQAPNLKYLKAAGQFWHAYRAFAQVTNLSQLKQVAFTGCILPFPSTLFHGLIHLTLISPVPPTSVMMTTRALQACPDLESFTFEGVAHWDVSPSVSSAMLFKLRNLNLTLDDATILLPQIHAPSLQELTLHSSMSKRDDRMTLTLYSFLVHSCGPLTRLHVDNVGISPDGWR